MHVSGNEIGLGKLVEGVVQQINPGKGGVDVLGHA